MARPAAGQTAQNRPAAGEQPHRTDSENACCADFGADRSGSDIHRPADIHSEAASRRMAQNYTSSNGLRHRQRASIRPHTYVCGRTKARTVDQASTAFCPAAGAGRASIEIETPVTKAAKRVCRRSIAIADGSRLAALEAKTPPSIKREQTASQDKHCRPHSARGPALNEGDDSGQIRILDAADPALPVTELIRHSGHCSSIDPSTAGAASDEEPVCVEPSIYTHLSAANIRIVAKITPRYPLDSVAHDSWRRSES